MSAGSKVPGGASSTLDFMVNRLLRVSGFGESGSASWLTVRGRLLTVDSTTHLNTVVVHFRKSFFELSLSSYEIVRVLCG